MKASHSLNTAETARARMEAALAPVNKRLSALLEDSNASVFYQHGDGWVVLFDGDHNAPLWTMDIDKLLTLGKDEALAYLRERSI